MEENKKIKVYPNKGILFWITGLSGSGKTTLANQIKKEIEFKYGKTIVISGDDLRKIFSLKGYNFKERKKYLLMYHNFCKQITDQNVNVIFAVVGLFDFIRRKNRSKINNYVEIFIKTKIENIKKNGKKKQIYKLKKNIVGKDLKAEFPKNPHIIIDNDFKKKTKYLKKFLLKEIFKLITFV